MGSNNNFKMRLLQASVLAVLILTALYVSRTPVPAQKGGGQIRSRTTSRIKHVARVMYPLPNRRWTCGTFGRFPTTTVLEPLR